MNLLKPQTWIILFIGIFPLLSLSIESSPDKSQLFQAWYAEQIIPGQLNPEKPMESTKVYGILYNFMYGEDQLTVPEASRIPSVLKNLAAQPIINNLQTTPTVSESETQHRVRFFEDPQNGLGISQSKAMKGFEKGLIQVTSVACLKNVTEPGSSHLASQLFLSDSFRNQIMPGRKSWDGGKNLPLCERVDFKYLFYFHKTFLYCMESQILDAEEASFLQLWNISNGLIAQGLTNHIFYNHLLASFQETPQGLRVAINVFVRGLGGAGLPKKIVHGELLGRQELIIRELEKNLANTSQ